MPPPTQRTINDVPEDMVGERVTEWMGTVPLPPTKIVVQRQPNGKYTIVVDIP